MFDLRPYNRKNNVTSYNPFREMDSFFDDPFRFFDGKALAEFNTDIIESGNNYILEADLPGFEKGDIKLDVKDDILTIKAERHTETEKKDKDSRSICCERSYGSYSRQFDVSGIDTDKISAKYENGVLKLTMPKKEAPKETSNNQKITRPGERQLPGSFFALNAYNGQSISICGMCISRYSFPYALNPYFS